MPTLPQITLPTGRTTSVLGFGGNQLVGPKPRSEALALLETAYSCGIKHFDVARGYGYGDAEGIIGEFAQNKRDHITITTKFGMQPDARMAKMRGVVGIARKVMRFAPGLRKALSRGGSAMLQTGAFGVEQARESLATSLRELQTETIDLYLLHGCKPEDCASPGLREFLEEAQAQGSIGRFGVGTHFADARRICVEHPAFAHVTQFENSATAPTLPDLPAGSGRVVVTFGAVGGDTKNLLALLSSDATEAQRWEKELDIDCKNAAVLSSLLLNWAVFANPGGIVLFTSTKPQTVETNARAIAESPFEVEQLRRFGELSRSVAPRLTPT